MASDLMPEDPSYTGTAMMSPSSPQPTHPNAVQTLQALESHIDAPFSTAVTSSNPDSQRPPPAVSEIADLTTIDPAIHPHPAYTDAPHVVTTTSPGCQATPISVPSSEVHTSADIINDTATSPALEHISLANAVIVPNDSSIPLPEADPRPSSSHATLESGGIQALLDNLMTSRSADIQIQDVSARPGAQEKASVLVARSPSIPVSQSEKTSIPEDSYVSTGPLSNPQSAHAEIPDNSSDALVAVDPMSVDDVNDDALKAAHVVDVPLVSSSMQSSPQLKIVDNGTNAVPSFSEATRSGTEETIDEFGRSVVRMKNPHTEREVDRTPAPTNDDLPSGDGEAYQQFLRDETAYVAEGAWDRFPQGSRVFVGNLFTERVSKRTIWNIFSQYGKMAQISMKNAYGFIQYVDPGSSQKALQIEQGREVGGRSIQLEIAKPQRNSKAATSNGNGRVARGRQQNSANEPQQSRRSREDQRSGRGQYDQGSMQPDRYNGGRSRSRSPQYHSRGSARYRSRSPAQRDLDEDVNLPLPRRTASQVPDVQAIIIDDVDRAFVGYIQQAFRERGLQCEILQLSRKLSLQAVIKRQILEGVLAVVRMYRSAQATGKIPLQVFDRSGGTSNVRFDEYENLDASTAADVVVRAKYARFQPSQSSPAASYTYGGMTQPPQQQQQIPNTANTNIASVLASLDRGTLQQLLGTLNPGNPQAGAVPQPFSPSAPLDAAAQAQTLTALLGAMTGQTQSTPASGVFPNQPQQQQQQTFYQPNTPVFNQQQQQNAQTQQGATQGQNVQDIMAQLAKYRS